MDGWGRWRLRYSLTSRVYRLRIEAIGHDSKEVDLEVSDQPELVPSR